MIKTAFITAAFALTAGAAFAQQTTAPMPTTSTMPATSSMPATPTMTANMPAGDAPATYPMCTKKGQDRCKQRHAM